MTEPHGTDIVLGVTGGIAAYKAAMLASLLKKQGHSVHVIMTRNACRFVTPLTFETLTGHPVVSDTFERPNTWEVEHVALAERARLFVIAPATANIIAKMACGIADDMLSTTVLATRAPVLIAPAMNNGMWEAAATQRNMQTLKERGVRVIGPDSGRLACGTVGPGRMSEPEAIADAVSSMLQSRLPMKGLRVLVTAGPTREPVDPVRYLSNRSSGKMGYAIAEAALERGADVTLVTGPVALTPPRGASVARVTTTQDLLEVMLEKCGQQDIIIQAAAPADFTPAVTADQKIKKSEGEGLSLLLEQTPDVAKAVGARKRPRQILIGFAAETERVEDHAEGKLRKKNLDMIIANDVTAPGAGFDVDTNIAALITSDQIERLPIMSKRTLAEHILDGALKLRAENAD